MKPWASRERKPPGICPMCQSTWRTSAPPVSSSDLLKNLFFVFQQAESELLLETGGAEVRHVDWHMGQIPGGFLSRLAQGFICQVRYIPVEADLQSEQFLPVAF